jgi:hypothetical protein
MLERLPLVPREDALLVEAPVSNDTARLMLLGGRRQGTVFGDVWQRSNGAWSQVVAEGGPGPLEHAAAAYDPVRARIVVFGGASGRTLSDRTWEFDGTRWHAIDAPGPAPRVGHGMVWSRQDGGILMYGGFGEDRFRDLWKWDGVRWQRLAGDGPTFTEGHVVAAADTGIFVVGPGLGDEPGVRVWQWRDGRFMQVGPSGPPLRVGATAVYDRSRRVLVLWGGSDADGRPDPTVHEFDGAAWRTASQRGEGPAGR